MSANTNPPTPPLDGQGEIKISENIFNALHILKHATYDKPLLAKRFAKEMWPHSPIHTKRSKQGNGTTIGKAAWLCAGSYMGRLIKKGLVQKKFGQSAYYLTPQGRKLL